VSYRRPTAWQQRNRGWELHVFCTPQPEEIAWAQGQARSGEHLLALMVQAKCFGRLGYFPRLEDVPDAVVGHIRRDLGLGEDVFPVYDSDRTRGAHRTLIRRRSEVVSDMSAARAVAAAAIGEAARRVGHEITAQPAALSSSTPPALRLAAGYG
jgi:Domain of unknown function (DUF4158)